MHEFHEFSSMFPLMEGEALDELIEDIRKHGQRELIVTLDGKILDGRNRYIACQKLKLAPRTRAFNCVDGDPLEYVWSANVTRRHLKPGQKAIAMAKRVIFLEKGNVAAQKSGAPRGRPEPLSTQQAADLAGVGTRTITRAKTVVKHGTKDELKAVESGKKELYTLENTINDRRRANGEIPASGGFRGVPARGIRIRVPPGKTLEDQIRYGLTLEKDLTAEEIAKKIGVHDSTYRMARDIVLLSDRTDLSEFETKLVKKALDEMNFERQVANQYKIIKYIAERVWRSRARTKKSENKILENFDHSINVIVYSAMANIEIPQLTKERAESVVEELTEAVHNIHKLLDRIKEIHFG